MTTPTPLRWGILSTARIARTRFIPGVRASTEGTVAAVASRDAGRARAVAAELEIPRAHGSYEALLADPGVDAVYIGLPNGLHPEWTVRAAAAGKHILCEKPAARTRADAARMAAAARDAGVILMEAFMYRLHPQHARVPEASKLPSIWASRSPGKRRVPAKAVSTSFPRSRRSSATTSSGSAPKT